MRKLTLIISAIVLAFAGGAQADTLTVTNTSDGPAPGPVGSLRKAINDADSGDTIYFALPANSSVTLTSGHLLIDKSLTISGPGASRLSVRRDTATNTPQFRIFFVNGEWNVTIAGLTIANGSISGPGSVGAGIANLNGAVTITNSTLSGNSGGSGGIYNLGTLTITNSTISGNTAAYFGGGIYNERGTVNVTNSIISGNFTSGDGDGGGIYSGGGTVNVANSTISANSASGDGGGIHSDGGTVNVTTSTVSDNSAGSYGGGILNASGMVNLTNSTISRNSANGGSGISNFGTVTITTSTISGNTTSGANGGGIFNLGTVALTNSTISGNATSGGDGGGIFNSSSGMLTARNAIVAGNTAIIGGPDVFGALTSQGYNLIGNTSGATITGATTGNQFNVDPKLGVLQDNGGPTYTHALLAGSTAIEGGDSGGSHTDQRGFPRPVDSPAFGNIGDGSDIGAYEVQADLLPGCNIDGVVNNNDDSGAGSLRAVIAAVCAGSTITFAPSVRGTINLTSGELLIDKSLTISGPGANLLSVQRSAAAGTANFRIFHIGSFTAVASIAGLTIANGNTPRNAASINGGGIANFGTLTVTNSVITGNQTGDSGGGIVNRRTLTIRNSTISGNSATGGIGGGIDSTGTLEITHSTVSGNSVSGGDFGLSFGGGIANRGGMVTVATSTISGNAAQFAAGGIGASGGMVTVTNSTISGNTASRGGGFSNDTTVGLRARNTLIALNTAASGPDISGPLISEGFNLIGNSAGATITPARSSDQIGTADFPIHPLLGPLQENGGPTLTRALLSGSVAIDKGHSSGLSTDQRGLSRPVDQSNIVNVSGGDGGDIGAFEFGGVAASLKILSITRIGNGPVVLEVAGFPYGVHRIQASVDLSFGSFIDIATVTADAAGRFQYQDPVTGLTNFYRVAFP